MTVRNSGVGAGTHHYEVVKSNTDPLIPTPRFLYVNSTGTLTVVDQANVAVTYNVTAGQTLGFRALRVHTDSTANVVAWY